MSLRNLLTPNPTRLTKSAAHGLGGLNGGPLALRVVPVVFCRCPNQPD
jgi:hypothetical protein